MMFRRTMMALLAAAVATPLLAAPLAPPEGPVLLTVTGGISKTNTEAGATFDSAMLRELNWQEIKTYTPFTKGVQRFAGPTLASLLEEIGVDAGTLQATALDDYTISIPVSDLETHDILLAMEHNGAPMRVRNKGPIWVIYPAGSPDEIGDRHSSHMIWQLTSIRVDP